MKIERLEKGESLVSAVSFKIKVNVQLLDKPKKGEYVLVHAGVAIEKIDPVKAKDTLALYEEIGKTYEIRG